MMGVPASPPAALIPMGFTVQLKTLQESQRQLQERFANLEHTIDIKDATIKDCNENIHTLLARIEALEQRNAHLTARRREAVSQLVNLRSLNQEASNAFHLRASDVQPDDLEGMLVAYGTSITTVMNHHQRMLGQMRLGAWLPSPFSTPGPALKAPQYQVPIAYAYPSAYNAYGFCHAHNAPYPCRACGN